MSDTTSKQQGQKKGHSNLYKWIVRGVWIAFIAFLIGFPLYIYTVSVDFLGLYGGLPSLEALENPKSDLSSELYSADNILLGKYYRENRSPVTYEELSPNLVNALVATEDIRFSEHSGIDLIGLARVGWGVFKNVVTFGASGLEGGGSTLSQQTAKNLYKTRTGENEGPLMQIPGLRILIVKTKEWLVAVKLEKYYTKKEILAMYLNTANFSSNSYGIKVAAKTFFNKHPHDLTIEESATIVGMLKASTYYNPARNPENSKGRRNVVIGQMYKNDFISEQQYDSLTSLPIVLDFKVDSHNEGLATYFRTVVQNWLLRWAREHGYDLFEDGLRIYTTIDSRMQEHAENAVKAHMQYQQELFRDHWKGRGEPWRDEEGEVLKGFIPMLAKRSERYQSLEKTYGKGNDSIDVVMNTPVEMTLFSWEAENNEIDTLMSPIDSIKYMQSFLHSGFMSMDPHNGHIKAWVGGINHKYFKYDHVMQGKRQPGSTFKPFVYAAAIDNGYSPCYEVVDAPVTFSVYTDGEEDTWTPQNATGGYSGDRMTIRQAMAQSKNSITAFVMKRIGPETVVEYAKRLGINSNIEAVPALSLGGGGDVSVYEMVGAYSTFVNHGTWTEPVFITRIEDKEGNTVYENPVNTREALSEETAYLMLYMLRGATEEEGGTGQGIAREIREGNEVGAKTGTTQNYSDGWFMGVTKDLVSGVWVGGDSRSVHFSTLALGQGARMAMPIWVEYMKSVYADERLDYEKGPFERPAGGISIEIDCDKYKSDIFGEEPDSLMVDEPVEQLDEESIF
ncbi:penicillin-binding protein 1A [Catalinimonas alkaloidigena]|uniref:penicillin-binding protein 1A n=1 Tax=Catalinimonas alkaloidigena TaxID=1075417 RepID=UPI002405D1B8|nr:transglycosylase domain-containing protein [Catalinimonas alkaloidigena]MDF9798299.1 penicillin-binding protein 1A [Catalinimonas alkaloidigena]